MPDDAPRPDLDEAERQSKYPHEPDMSWDEIEDRLRTADQAAVYQVFAYNERLGDLVARNGEELSQLRAALADAQAEIARLRAAWAELAAKLETLDDVSDDLDTHADSLPYRPDAERARGVAQGVRETAGQLRALAAAPVAPGRRTLTDDEYRRAVELCERVVDAAHSDDGGPTVAGHYIGKLRDLLAGADWREQP